MEYKLLITAALGVSLTGYTMTASADQALVVGVNSYANLPQEAQLDGSDNDADGMNAKLTSLGFKVTELKDGDATKAGVLAALSQLKSSVTPVEKFVFYFAGHGAKAPDGTGVILPSDASPSDQANYIGQNDLYNAVNEIPSAARTIVLDSCFSGAMSRGIGFKGISPHRKARFYNFFGATSKSIVLEPVNGKDDPTPVVDGNNTVCYFVAATGAEKAYEDDFDGKADGVFTHYFLQRLTTTTDPWSAVQSDVTAGVTDDTESNQSPVLTPAYSSVAVFTGLTSPPIPHRTVQSIWATFSENQTDPRQLQLSMNPNQAQVKVMDQFTFTANVGSAVGYLVIMEKDTDGNLNLLYPTSGKAADGAVTGSTVNFPPDVKQACAANKAGTESVKAILFKSQDDAQSLLSDFPPNGVIPSVASAMSRNIIITNANTVPFYTSTVGFEVVPATAGS